MTHKPFTCEHCPRRFEDQNALYQHAKTKHAGKKRPRRPVSDDDESFADRAVQAEIDRACGNDNDDIDWLI